MVRLPCEMQVIVNHENAQEKMTSENLIFSNHINK